MVADLGAAVTAATAAMEAAGLAVVAADWAAAVAMEAAGLAVVAAGWAAAVATSRLWVERAHK
jgi:hypothetical protein